MAPRRSSGPRQRSPSLRHAPQPTVRPAWARRRRPVSTRLPRDWIQISVTALPGLAAVIALIFTSLAIRATGTQLQIAEQGQITDRYNAAISNLGSSSVDVRLGGVYALQRIMQDSPRDQSTVVAVLCAFIRDHAKMATARPPHTSGTQSSVGLTPSTDVQAALTVVTTRDSAHDGPNTVVDFTGANLPGADLFNADLNGAILTDVNLTGADLTDANLNGAILNGAKLNSADLNSADLAGADAVFGLHLANRAAADLTTNVKGASFIGANLNNANLTGADLFATKLTRAYLFHANLTAASLVFANLTRANLTGADLSRADLLGGLLTRANLTGADLTGANVIADLTRANLTDANLTRANLTGAILRGAILRGAILTGTKGFPAGTPRPSATKH
jgi:uncharacterized protein YjbI with pentapeptide repeats